MQVLVGTAVEPALMGRAFNLSPLVVLISLAFWAMLWGIGGAILSVPLTASLIIVMGEFAADAAAGDAAVHLARAPLAPPRIGGLGGPAGRRTPGWLDAGVTRTGPAPCFAVLLRRPGQGEINSIPGRAAISAMSSS